MEALPEAAEGRGPTRRLEGREVEDGPHDWTTAADGSSAGPATAVARDGREARKRSDAAAVDLAEFGQLGDEGGGDD